MNNSTLTGRAKDLERELQSKLKCYVKVGWMRESDGTELYVVYVDYRANVDYRRIPDNWYGNHVDVQLILPPGATEPAPFLGP